MQNSKVSIIVFVSVIIIGVGFFLVSWMNFFGITSTGYELLTASQRFIQNDISSLFLIIFALIGGSVSLLWSLIDENAHKSPTIISFIAGIGGLLYYIMFLIQNGADFEGIGGGFWVTLFGCFGLIIPAFIPNNSPQSDIKIEAPNFDKNFYRLMIKPENINGKHELIDEYLEKVIAQLTDFQLDYLKFVAPHPNDTQYGWYITKVVKDAFENDLRDTDLIIQKVQRLINQLENLPADITIEASRHDDIIADMLLKNPHISYQQQIKSDLPQTHSRNEDRKTLYEQQLLLLNSRKKEIIDLYNIIMGNFGDEDVFEISIKTISK